MGLRVEDGACEGWRVGRLDGYGVGSDGTGVGGSVGLTDGLGDGAAEGRALGGCEGKGVGSAVGNRVGKGDVGLALGLRVKANEVAEAASTVAPVPLNTWSAKLCWFNDTTTFSANVAAEVNAVADCGMPALNVATHLVEEETSSRTKEKLVTLRNTPSQDMELSTAASTAAESNAVGPTPADGPLKLTDASAPR